MSIYPQLLQRRHLAYMNETDEQYLYMCENLSVFDCFVVAQRQSLQRLRNVQWKISRRYGHERLCRYVFVSGSVCLCVLRRGVLFVGPTVCVYMCLHICVYMSAFFVVVLLLLFFFLLSVCIQSKTKTVCECSTFISVYCKTTVAFYCFELFDKHENFIYNYICDCVLWPFSCYVMTFFFLFLSYLSARFFLLYFTTSLGCS